MGIKIFYIFSIIYGIVSGVGIFKRILPSQFLYVFLAVILFYFLYYLNRRKIILSHSVAGGIITNLSVQLTGGVASMLFFIYPLVLAIIGYREKYINYWVVALCLFVVETLSAVFTHTVMFPPLIIFFASAGVIGFIIKKQQESESFLKKSLMKYESRDQFLGPADFEQKKIVTSVQDIDRHRGIERPLLYFVKLIHRMFNAYTTAIFSYYNDNLTLIQGFSHSELFRPDTVIDVKSGIYRQVIASGKVILIKEFVQNPDELGYYRGEVKVGSVLIAPIILLNKVEGILIMDRKDQLFDEEDKEKFTEAVHSAGYLLAMLRLYEQKSYEAKYLKEISEHIKELNKEELDLDKILSDAAQFFKEVMECNDVGIAAIDELNEEGEVLYSTYVEEKTKFSFDDGLVGFVARHRDCIIKDDLGKGNVVVLKKSIKTRNLSFVGIPVFRDEELLGVIWLEDHRKKKFNRDNIDALNILASQLSFAWQRAALHNKVKELSERDGLTGLYNHRYFQEILEKELKKKRELVLLLFDIDHFKQINDTYGHQGGDKVLEFLGRLMTKSKNCISARYGGEEFVMIFPRCSLKKGIDHAVHLKDHLLKSSIKVDHTRIKITVSIGVAHYPTDAETRDELIRKADEAMYWAKQNGRDQVAVAKTLADKKKTSSKQEDKDKKSLVSEERSGT
ncbi:MAG TPA: diguanylate cyclase [candidate division WOR-3 bacterium]|uniref:Diguanylate cyclase n=1 Tax=candidate division WOR-3 bacterium TaxID=2052148 RepID=A0A9C9EMY8_UNCW3|nr:diguanylate cyclase [candidate division WOR-3 bacterium]